MVKFVTCLPCAYAKDEDGNLILFDGMPIRELVEVPEGVELKSLFASLPPEKQKAVLEYDGPEDRGDPEWRRKK